MHRNGGRLASGMPVGIPLESRSASERNADRHEPESALAIYGQKTFPVLPIDLVGLSVRADDQVVIGERSI